MPESISKRTSAEKQASKDQGVAVDHPLQALKRAMQIVLHGRERHIDDGCIKNNHEEPEADGRQPRGMKRPFLWKNGRSLSFSWHTLLRFLCWLCKQLGETTAQQAFRAIS